jgi:hypothetical protein
VDELLTIEDIRRQIRELATEPPDARAHLEDAEEALRQAQVALINGDDTCESPSQSISTSKSHQSPRQSQRQKDRHLDGRMWEEMP